jgi:autotransporter adhesin
MQRQITNVAPGAVNATSTDAVNGAQLYGVQQTAEQASQVATQAYQQVQVVQQTVTAQGNTINQIVNGVLGLCTANPDGSMQCRPLPNSKPSSASGAGAVAIGVGTQAHGEGAQAIGPGASAGYAGSLAIGQGATITAPTDPTDRNVIGAIAIGQGARANADPATAVGYQANAAGSNSVALGYAATANGNNSVALGAGSVANRDNSVSVGDAATGMQRQITNVAPGTMPSDAVNLGQVQGMIYQATSGILNQANRHADAVAAMSAATSMTPMFGPKGYSLTAATANVGSQTALGIGFARSFYVKDHPAYVQASVGINSGGGSAVVKVGASIGW